MNIAGWARGKTGTNCVHDMFSISLLWSLEGGNDVFDLFFG